MYFLVMAFCLALNGVIACVEMAFVAASPHELKKLAAQGDMRAARILALRAHPERTLSVLQVGITLVTAVSAAVGGAGAEKQLAPKFEVWLGVSEVSSEYIAIGLIVVPITFFTVVLGELVPKAFALRDAVRINLWSVRVLEIADRVLAPAIGCMEWLTKAVMRLFGRAERASSCFHDPAVVALDGMSEGNQAYVRAMASLENKRLRDLLVPIEWVVTLDYAMDPDTVLRVMLTSGHTRLPVRHGADIVGFVQTKEFAASRFLCGQEHWHKKIRTLYRATADSSPLDVLRDLQARKEQMVLVTGEHGECKGVVTIDDIFAHVVGAIDHQNDGQAEPLALPQAPPEAMPRVGASATEPLRNAGRSTDRTLPR